MREAILNLIMNHIREKDSMSVLKSGTQGSIIVFPSYMYHQVTPVTKGNRYSLVLWALGEPLNNECRFFFRKTIM